MPSGRTVVLVLRKSDRKSNTSRARRAQTPPLPCGLSTEFGLIHGSVSCWMFLGHGDQSSVSVRRRDATPGIVWWAARSTNTGLPGRAHSR